MPIMIGGYFVGAKLGREEGAAELTQAANATGRTADREITSIQALKDQHVSSIRQQVKTMMKNPASTVFRDVRYVSGYKGQPVVCGYVNADNSYGKTAGESRFVAAFDMIYLLESSSKSIEAKSAWNDYCD
jgi:hypothetical protein